MSESLKVEAIKIGFKQSKEGDVVTYRLHPSDDVRQIAEMPLGTRVILAVAEISD